MPTFTITTDNAVTAFAAFEDALNVNVDNTDACFCSERELAKITAGWPAFRLVEIWNTFAGVVPFDDLKPVAKFKDRKTAIARIWNTIQALAPIPARHAAPAAPKQPKATKQAKAAGGTRPPREFSKKVIVIDLIKRAEGATIQELMAATQWQAHSVRGFISGSLGKKMGLKIDSEKRPDGVRAYKVGA